MINEDAERIDRLPLHRSPAGAHESVSEVVEMLIRWRSVGFAALTAALSVVAWAVPLRPGDIVASVILGTGGSTALVRVDPGTGAQELISSG